MHTVRLTLNQDKRRRFDSYPGSNIAGQPVEEHESDAGSCAELHPTVSPNSSEDATPATYHRPASALLLDMTPRLVDIAARDHRAPWATLGASQPVEAPLPDEGERELVYREGYGWVSRPVEVEPIVVPVEEPRREIARVAA